MRTILLAVVLCLPGFAAAQDAGDATRGSTPPGMSQDGARPAEGALKGGTLAPGESGGTPDAEPAKSAPGSAAAGGSSRQLARCYELDGSLREQCLADDASKRSGPARAPSDATTPSPRD
jgi:hypothetical protein